MFLNSGSCVVSLSFTGSRLRRFALKSTTGDCGLGLEESGSRVGREKLGLGLRTGSLRVGSGSGLFSRVGFSKAS